MWIKSNKHVFDTEVYTSPALLFLVLFRFLTISFYWSYVLIKNYKTTLFFVSYKKCQIQRQTKPFLISTAPPASCSWPVHLAHLDCINLRPTANPSPGSAVRICRRQCSETPCVWPVVHTGYVRVCMLLCVCVSQWSNNRWGSRSNAPVCTHSAQRSCVRGSKGLLGGGGGSGYHWWWLGGTRAASGEGAEGVVGAHASR